MPFHPHIFLFLKVIQCIMTRTTVRRNQRTKSFAFILNFTNTAETRDLFLLCRLNCSDQYRIFMPQRAHTCGPLWVRPVVSWPRHGYSLTFHEHGMRPMRVGGRRSVAVVMLRDRRWCGRRRCGVREVRHTQGTSHRTAAASAQ